MLFFEWDKEKAATNLAKHGIAFGDATAAFDDLFAVDIEDRSMDYGEVRRQIIAMVGDHLITVVYTERGAAIRLISARPSTRREHRFYESGT